MKWTCSVDRSFLITYCPLHSIPCVAMCSACIDAPVRAKRSSKGYSELQTAQHCASWDHQNWFWHALGAPGVCVLHTSKGASSFQMIRRPIGMQERIAGELAQLASTRVKAAAPAVQEVARASGQTISGSTILLEELLRRPHVTYRYPPQSPVAGSSFG